MTDWNTSTMVYNGRLVCTEEAFMYWTIDLDRNPIDFNTAIAEQIYRLYFDM